MNEKLHVAIIMDGNGRWAEKRNLKRSEGHLAGSNNLEDLIKHIFKKGIKVLSIYAFSVENFKRDKEEVDYLMNLFIKVLKTKFDFLKKQNVKIVFSKKEKGLPLELENLIKEIEIETMDNKDHILNICLNYSHQEEIVDMVKKVSRKVLNGDLKIEELSKDIINENLYQELPPIDLLIRTSGEYRLSNFMMYQLSYAEFYFTNTLFPDFKARDFDLALEAYYKRNRRFGLNQK